MTEQKNKTREQTIKSLQLAVQEHKSNLDVNYDYLLYASRTSGKLLLRDTTKNLIASTATYLKNLESILADI